MTAQLLRLDVAWRPCAEPLPRAQIDELHALLALDPIGCASPARTLFVVSQAAKARLARRLCPTERDRALQAPALAVVGYDFPFAVSLILSIASDHALAIRTAARSAALQGACLVSTAASLGLAATPIANFDAGALRAEFFAGTEATVVCVCRLAPG